MFKTVRKSSFVIAQNPHCYRALILKVLGILYIKPKSPK